MSRLGYDPYRAQGGDTGAPISPQLGRIEDQLIGVHVNNLLTSPPGGAGELEDLSVAGQKRLERMSKAPNKSPALREIERSTVTTRKRVAVSRTSHGATQPRERFTQRESFTTNVPARADGLHAFAYPSTIGRPRSSPSGGPVFCLPIRSKRGSAERLLCSPSLKVGSPGKKWRAIIRRRMLATATPGHSRRGTVVGLRT
jgi:hypothetical protein